MDYLTAIRTAKPTDAEIESIKGGLLRLQQPLDIPDDQILQWINALRDQAV
jgi:hypothetical protein